MSGINIVRNLQVLYFSGENKEIKNLKNDKTFVARYRQLYILFILAKLVVILKLGLRSISKRITSLIFLNNYTPLHHALAYVILFVLK